MAFRCLCGMEFEVRQEACGRLTYYRCGSGHTYWGPLLPRDFAQAVAWMRRKTRLRIGRLVTLVRIGATYIVAIDHQGRRLRSWGVAPAEAA